MNIETARKSSEIPSLDTEILLSYACKRDRSFVIAHPEYELSSQEEKEYMEYMQRRKHEEPLAYIIGKKEFYGRDFITDSRVLIPRPATEALVEVAIHAKEGISIHSADTGISILSVIWGEANKYIEVGTGSGCIAITLALETGLPVHASDTSVDALTCAKENAKIHQVRINWKQGGLLDPFYDTKDPFILVSNPPYIPSDVELENTVAKFEPNSALFAGKEGTDVLLPLVKQAKTHPACKGCIIECREDQLSTILQVVNPT